MLSVTITPIYAALTALLMLALSVRVSKYRLKHQVSLGDGGDKAVGAAVRGFGNLTEYAAVILVLLFLMEMQGIGAIWLHAYGTAFIISRILHPLGLVDGKPPKWKILSRQAGATGTLILLLVGALTLLFA